MTTKFPQLTADIGRRFRSAAEGTAAIEFAFIAPLLIAAVLALVDVSAIATGSENMQTAVHSGILYVVAGGSDLTVAENQVLQAWTSKPDGGTVSSQQYCKCGDTTSSCTTLCADNTIPASFIALSATASLGGTTFSLNKTTTETVRVR